MVIARTIPTMLAVLPSCDTLGGLAGGGTEGDILIIVMEELKVTEVVVSVEEVTACPGGGDIAVEVTTG